MERHIDEMVRLLGPDTQLVEFGSGASVKTRLLVDRLEPSLYVPIDIAEAALRDACDDARSALPVAQHQRGRRPTSPARSSCPSSWACRCTRKVVYFPGSTIGNFTPDEALEFLPRACATSSAAGGMLLIGVDLKKDKRVLDAAYDDAQGVTAEFNLNLLARINRELGGDFQVKRFRHKAFYDERTGGSRCISRACTSQFVHVAGQRFEFRAGETIHTEISCKYRVEEFQRLRRARGSTPRRYGPTRRISSPCTR